MVVPLPVLLKTDYFAGCEVAAGGTGIDRDVTSINIIDGTFGFKYSKENMLVLCSAYSIASSYERQIDLIEQIAARGAVGIACKTVYFPDGKIPDSMLQRADELGIPLIALSVDCPAYAEFITLFANSIYLRGTETIMARNDLLKLLIRTMSKSGLPGLVEQISTLLDKNVSVLFEDEHYAFPMNEETREFGRAICAQSGTWHFSESPLFDGMLCYSDQLGDIRKPDPDKLGVAVRSGKNMIAYLWVYGSGVPCTCNEYAALDSAALACELEMGQILTYQQQEAHRRLLFVEHLLTGQVGTMHEALLMTKGLQWRIPLETRIMVVACVSGCVLCQEIELELNTLFRQQQQNIIVFPFRGNVAVFLPPLDEGYDFCGESIRVLEEKYGSGTLHFGLGRGVTLQNIYKSYSEAIYALQVCRAIDPEERVCRFETLGMFRLSCRDALPEEQQRFCEDYVLPLIQVDANAKLDLLRTLETFFACKENYSRAGNMLYLHPNTIRYRIETIAKICNVNFDNPSDILNMQIALKLLPVVRQNLSQPLPSPDCDRV